MGWAGPTNGVLMKMAAGKFDVFVTADQNLRYQQNLAYARIEVIVLVAFSNRVESLLPLMPQANAALQTVATIEVIQIEFPQNPAGR